MNLDVLWTIVSSFILLFVYFGLQLLQIEALKKEQERLKREIKIVNFERVMKGEDINSES